MGRRADNKAFEMMTAAADKTAVNFEGGVKPPDKEYGTLQLHTTLAGAGFLPAPVGTAADVVDALLYIVEGKKGEAVIAGLSALPAGSLLFGTAKAGRKVGRVLHRGIGSGEYLDKTFRTTGRKGGEKFLSMSDAQELVTKTETEVMDEFKKQYIEGGYKVVGKEGILHTTTAAAEAGAIYGEKILRLEIDPNVIYEMQHGMGVGKNTLLKTPSQGARGLPNVFHYIFNKGLRLEDVNNLRIFQDYNEYVQWMLDTGHIKNYDLHKYQQMYWDYKRFR